MAYVKLVAVRQCSNDLSEETNCFNLAKPASCSYVVKKFTTFNILKNEVSKTMLVEQKESEKLCMPVLQFASVLPHII